jgi:hypothetical protein
MWEWVENNKEWVFSGGGLTLLAFLIWAGRSVFQRLNNPRPQVKLNLATLVVGLRVGNSRALTISLLNPTDYDVVIGNFVLELANGETIYFPVDYFTGELQRKNVVKPGDSCAFHIGIADLRQTGRRLADFRCALVQTPAGPGYRSTRHELHRFLRHILKETVETC